MVEYRRILAEDWRKLRPQILSLIRRYRDGHITRAAFSHVQQLRSRSLEQEGNVIWTAWVKRKLVGVIIFERYGNRTAMVVVHREHRGQGISREMIRLSVQTMGRFYAEIASDNLPSLRTAFGAGMVAYDAFVRRGKVTLRVRNAFNPEK
ncbi:MAG: GNAT family N-acetyltransferase [Bacillota bacterium]|jgi:RimJ/RimL family protein N-acetyltransferase